RRPLHASPTRRSSDLARAERIAQAGVHAIAIFCQLRLALDHGRRWRPGRPFPLHGDARRTGPAETFSTHTNAVTHGLAFRHDEIDRKSTRLNSSHVKI